jgi:hypothetical protein
VKKYKHHTTLKETLKMSFRKNINFRRVLTHKKTDYFFIELLILTILALIYCYFSVDINECFIYKDISNMEVSGRQLAATKTAFLLPANTYNENKVYSVMHKMANTKIIAEDGMIWGSIAINKKNINTVRSIVEKIDYKDRPYLLSVLKRWENNDFKLAPQEHNYFWEMLGGTVGRAVDNSDE